MGNPGLDEAQAGIKITGRNSNIFKYAYHHNGRKQRGIKELLDEGERAESEKTGLKLNIQKIKIMVSSPITSW